MKRQQGFTLIELVMVIVILGILSAFALPRFADLGGEAREASLNGAVGAVRSASSIVHAKVLAGGDASIGSITLEGTSIDVINGYPSASGIVDAAQLSSDDFEISDTATATSVTVTLGDCSFTYNEAVADASPDITAITGETDSGC